MTTNSYGVIYSLEAFTVLSLTCNFPAKGSRDIERTTYNMFVYAGKLVSNAGNKGFRH